MDSLDCYETPEELIMLAEFASQMGRPEDVLRHLECLIKVNPVLDQKTRNLFSSAFKYVIDHNRESLQIVADHVNQVSDSQKRDCHPSQETALLYYNQIGKQLLELCGSTISLLDNYLIPNAVENSSKVFYQKWLGDCLRYQTEYEHEDRSQWIERAREVYANGLKLAEDSLDASDYHRLGLALNYSVFIYEVCNTKDKACEITKKALLEGQEALDLQPERSSECEVVLRLLHDNLEIWGMDSSDTD